MRYSTCNAIPQYPESKKQPYETLETSKLPANLPTSPRRLERPTYRLGGGRSIQLSYEDKGKTEITCRRNDRQTKDSASESERLNCLSASGTIYYNNIIRKSQAHFPGSFCSCSNSPIFRSLFLRRKKVLLKTGYDYSKIQINPSKEASFHERYPDNSSGTAFLL